MFSARRPVNESGLLPDVRSIGLPPNLHAYAQNVASLPAQQKRGPSLMTALLMDTVEARTPVRLRGSVKYACSAVRIMLKKFYFTRIKTQSHIFLMKNEMNRFFGA